MQPSDDGVDFKPFFDMVVGVLFFLLILVAAQMFFTQWGSTSEETTRDRTQRMILAWEQEASRFLDGIARRLRDDGLTANVDLVDKSISVPIGEVASFAASGPPRIEGRPAGLIGQTLAEQLHCLPGQTGPRSGECPAYELLRLGQVKTEVHLQGAPKEAQLPADRYARLVSTLLNAALLQKAPDLLGATGAGGGPALQTGSTGMTPDPDGAAQGIRGDFALRFVFERPFVEP